MVLGTWGTCFALPTIHQRGSMCKLLLVGLLSFFAAACADGHTEQQRAVASDIRRYFREQDIPADVAVNGNTLTVAYRAATIEYAPDTFVDQQGQAGLDRIADAGFETLEIQAKSLTGQQQSKSFRVADLRPRRGASKPVDADLSNWQDPNVACSYLVDRGLPTGGYKNHGDDEWWCLGTRVTSSEGALVPDEVTYMAEGDASRVREITLIAEHYASNPGDEKFTLGRTAIAAETVATAIFGEDLPNDALEAFRAGRAGTWSVKGTQVEVERDEDPSERGYSVYFRITSRD